MSNRILLCLALFWSVTLLKAQENVGIGTTNPAPSAALEIASSNQGFLIPRVDTGSIASPIATGLMTYQSSDARFYFYNGSNWEKIDNGQVADSDGDTKIIAENHAANDVITFSLDGNESVQVKRNAAGDILLEMINPLQNTALGDEAMEGNLSGNLSVAIGHGALKAGESGTKNTAVGYQSLNKNTSGFENTALGAEAMLNNTTGHKNVAIGNLSLYNSKAKLNNVAIGHLAMFGFDSTATIDQTHNTAVGYFAQRGGTDVTQNTGKFNTSLGSLSLSSVSTGGNNTALGYNALAGNTTGSQNTSAGENSMLFNKTGNQNTSFGAQALFWNVGNSRSTAIGFRSMVFADNRTSGQLTYNTAVGFEALRGSFTPADNTGIKNTAIGDQALVALSSGTGNTALGASALSENSTGDNNTGLGKSAGRFNTGSGNVFIGFEAGKSASGDNELYISNADDGSSDALIYGDFSAGSLRVNDHLGIGRAAESTFAASLEASTIDGTTDGVLKIYDSSNSDAWHLQLQSSGDLSFSETGVADNRFVLEQGGNIGLSVANPSHPLQLTSGANCDVAGTWNNASDRRLKKNIEDLKYGLTTLNQLRPVSYQMRSNEQAQIGFIAQEVQEILPELIVGKEGDLEKGETLSMSYGNLTAVLVKSVQEQQTMIAAQQKAIEQLQAQLGQAEANNAQLQSSLGEQAARLDAIEAKLAEEN